MSEQMTFEFVQRETIKDFLSLDGREKDLIGLHNISPLNFVRNMAKKKMVG